MRNKKLILLIVLLVVIVALIAMILRSNDTLESSPEVESFLEEDPTSLVRFRSILGQFETAAGHGLKLF